jgi:hypothetical protein
MQSPEQKRVDEGTKESDACDAGSVGKGLVAGKHPMHLQDDWYIPIPDSIWPFAIPIRSFTARNICTIYWSTTVVQMYSYSSTLLVLMYLETWSTMYSEYMYSCTPLQLVCRITCAEMSSHQPTGACRRNSNTLDVCEYTGCMVARMRTVVYSFVFGRRRFQAEVA